MRFGLKLALVTALAAPALVSGQDASTAMPLSIGETFTIESKAVGERRNINVYLPGGYGASSARYPVLYMPDGGIAEDFQHVAGLLQVLVGNGSMRPFILIGIENTERRRDLTGPTDNPEDRKIAPRVGGSAPFRRFIRAELKPVIEQRYRTTGESAIVGESLAGLFIVETLFTEPDLFDTYIAFDPSLWWNNGALLTRAGERMGTIAGKTVYLASSNQKEIAQLTAKLADLMRARAPTDARVDYAPMPEESHATIYHPAALRAFKTLWSPQK
jgi:uncharacterized protein